MGPQIRMYCPKMIGYEENEKLLIHYFQDSLTGTALRWYIGLDPIRIQTWIDLAHAFLDQYKHVSNWALDHLSLIKMEKKASESLGSMPKDERRRQLKFNLY